MIAGRMNIGSSLIQIECSWTEFKAVMSSKDLVIQHAKFGDVYHIFCTDMLVVYSTFLYTVESESAPPNNADDLADFESNFLALTNKPLTSTRADGVQRVQLEPAAAVKRAQIKGFKLIPAIPNPATETVKESHVDIGWDSEVSFQGIQGINIINQEERDYLKLSAILPIGTTYEMWGALMLGPWPFGPAMSTPMDIELFVFGVDVHLPASGNIAPIIAESSFTFPPAIKLRFKYYAHGAVAPRMVGLVRVWI